ncbi:DgyrCDS7362 [Dimorphilus gyrociliatus]|uniref:Germinal-center associated nuclear protein n=1 Tax=Dimorphilus gyrociliatus TaxID=2664684 RepID=A0A7I8VR10_9ANNE|nr:DgyrCDS7362 [Dimorphilus gyrociliatus]
MEGNCNNAIQSSNPPNFTFSFTGANKEGLFGRSVMNQNEKQQTGGSQKEKLTLFGKEIVGQDSNKAPNWNPSVSSSNAPNFEFSTSSKSTFGLFGKPANKEQDGASLFASDDGNQRPKTGLFGKEVQNENKGKFFDTRKHSQLSSTSKFSLSNNEGSTSKRMLFGKGNLAQDEKVEKKIDEPATVDKRPLFNKGALSEGETKKQKKDWLSTNLHERLFRRAVPGLGSDRPKLVFICKKIPIKFNKKDILNKHFKTFGQVTKISINSFKQTAIVHFADTRSALEAKKHGTRIHGMDHDIEIVWAKTNPPSNASQNVPQRSGASEVANKGNINDELLTMKGTTDIEADFNFPDSTVERLPLRTRPRPASPVRVDSPVNSRSVSPAPIRYNELVTGKNAGEKWLVLDNYDKKYRKNFKDKPRRGHVMGTCPDMCPEKERYFREDKRRLSIYEVVPGHDIVDHSRAVKEYSRSSADQEMPLPHEVRPVYVLEKTMNYLLQTVLKMPDEAHWDEWYDFLWNRTRAIRKDITQQQLCDTSTVSLVEKCARFHIYCSHRLCELHMAVFDKKINDENLTKCLQTLKELYKDLESKGILCPNEAEFRSYIVLMNLNGGDCLREVQQLRFEVRESKQVRYVVKVHQTLNANNYVRFFKLVKKASFLQAAILHRYFVQVRTFALKVMCKAYTANTQIPIGDLVDQLCFEDEFQAQEFFHHFEIETTNQHVVLKQKSLIKPEAEFKLKRAIQLVESKMEEPLEEVINGGPLEKLNVEEPSSSFDKDGRFYVQAYMQVAPTESEPTESAEKSDEEVINSIFENFLNETCRETILTIIESVHSDEKLISNIRINICSELITTTVNSYIAEICQECKREEVEIHHRNRAEAAAIKQAAIQNCTNSLTDLVVNDLCREITSEELHRAEREWTEKFNLSYSEELLSSLVEDIVVTDARHLSFTIHEKSIQERKQFLQNALEKVQILRLGNLWKSWKFVLKKQLQLKWNMKHFPSAPPILTTSEQLNSLSQGIRLEGDNIHIGHAKVTAKRINDIAYADLNIKKAIEEAEKRLCDLEHKFLSPLSLSYSIGSHLAKNCKSKHIYCKILLAHPETDHKLTQWLKQKFSQGAIDDERFNIQKSKLLSLYTTDIENKKITFCIRTLQGIGSNDATLRQVFKGTSAVILCTSSETGIELNKRIDYIRTLPLQSQIPILVMSSNLIQFQKLQGFSDFRMDILPFDNKVKTLDMLEENLEWLALRLPCEILLKSSDLCDYVSDILQTEYFNLVYRDLMKRRKQNLLDRGPQIMIQFYNDVLKYIAESIIASSELSSWPIYELAESNEDLPPNNWNDSHIIEYITDFIFSLTLPDFEFTNEKTENWSDVVNDVTDFLDAAISTSDLNSSLLYTKYVILLLNY